MSDKPAMTMREIREALGHVQPGATQACALCDVVKPDQHALRDHVLNVHPNEFCGIYHDQPCQHDRRDRYLTALLDADPYALVERRDDRTRFADAVMVVADAESAAMAAEIRRLRASEADGWAKACGYNERWVKADDALTDERLLTHRLRTELSRQGRAYKTEIQRLQAELANRHAEVTA